MNTTLSIRMQTQRCEFCDSKDLIICNDDLTCNSCYCVQSVQPQLDYYPQPQIKKQYQKLGVQSQLKTEYYNIIKEYNVQGSKELIDFIVDQNEKYVQVCKNIFLAIVKPYRIYKESIFKRNYMINQNMVLFYVLVHLKRFDVLEKILPRFKYSYDLKLKKIYLQEKEKIDLKKIEIDKIQFIDSLIHSESSDVEIFS